MSPPLAKTLITDFESRQKSLIVDFLSKCLHREAWTDVVLVCGGGGQGTAVDRVPAHKLVLAASSKFFRDLFNRDTGMPLNSS